jgi:hypothetical protein
MEPSNEFCVLTGNKTIAPSATTLMESTTAPRTNESAQRGYDCDYSSVIKVGINL